MWRECCLIAGIVLIGTLFPSSQCPGAERSVTVMRPPHDAGGESIEQQLSRARQYEAKGHLAKARNIYARIHGSYPDNVVACHRLGVVLARSGEVDDAVQYLLVAVEQSPHDCEILTDLGYATYLQNDLGAAEIALEQALSENPNSRRAAKILALVREKQGRFEESTALFRQVLDNRAAGRDSVMDAAGSSQQLAQAKEQSPANHESTRRAAGPTEIRAPHSMPQIDQRREIRLIQPAELVEGAHAQANDNSIPTTADESGHSTPEPSEPEFLLPIVR